MLLELLNLHALSQLRVEDAVVLENFVALVADFNHGSDDLWLDEQRVEAECRELLGEVVRGDGHQAQVWHFLWLRLRWQLQVRRYQLRRVVLEHAATVVVVLHEELSLLFIVDRLFHDDLVHSSAEFTNNLRQDASLVDLRAILQGFGSHSYFIDSGAL